jgi:hypothetical protein
MLIGLAGLSIAASTIVMAARVHDWHDLDAVHNHVVEAIQETERASAAPFDPLRTMKSLILAADVGGDGNPQL